VVRRREKSWFQMRGAWGRRLGVNGPRPPAPLLLWVAFGFLVVGLGEEVGTDEPTDGISAKCAVLAAFRSRGS
jgi:hypothetical protein